MTVTLEVELNDNKIVLSGPLEEIKKLIVAIKADEGKEANIALDDALLMNDTIYQITKPVYHERDKLKHEIKELIDEAEARCCPEEPDVAIPSVHEWVSRGQCGNLNCPICYPCVHPLW